MKEILGMEKPKLVSEESEKLFASGFSEDLRKSGFSNASKIVTARQYLSISEETIGKFLRKRAEFECFKAGASKVLDISTAYVRNDFLIENYVEFEKGRFINAAGYSGQLKWIETLVENYNSVPPKFVVEKINAAKEMNIFDYFTVATLEFTYAKVVDPLLFGRMKENSTRYFIAQWDDDLILDDII